MISFRKIEEVINCTWSTLGLPFSEPPVQESKVGLIDPEVTILMTLMFSNHSRIMTDVPAWVLKFSDLINNWKIKSLLSLLPNEQKEALIGRMRGSNFEVCPTGFKKACGLVDLKHKDSKREILSRVSKIKPIEALSDSCTMIKNRLLFGAGFRADLVSIIQAIPFPLRIHQVASLIGSAESTVSRIVADLQVCRFLDRHNQVSKDKQIGKGLFVSADSLRNGAVLLEASRFTSKELAQAELDGMELRFDGLMRKVGGDQIG
jgi:hypothetical protein